MGSAEPSLAGPIDAVLAQVAATRTVVTALERLSSGASRETWRVETRSPDGDDASLVLQLGPVEATGLGLPTEVEAELLRAARLRGVPVPDVVATGDANGPFGRPYLLTSFVQGEVLPQKVLRDPRLSQALSGLAGEAGRALAEIHRIEPNGSGLARSDPVTSARTVLDQLAETRPVLELALLWLDERRPESPAPVVVHGDFRLGNLIVDPAGLRAVVDWELAHLGDPLEDVAWAAIRAWRFDRHRPPDVFPDERAWIAAYEDARGACLDRDAYRWWAVAMTLRWAVICLVQSHRHLGGETSSVELAVIGRRVCESEWDLLGLTGAEMPAAGGPTGSRAGEPAGAAAAPVARGQVGTEPGLYGSASAGVLAGAVRDLLAGEVRPAVTGRLRHEVRVAETALAIVEREQRLSHALEECRAERLAPYGCASSAELAALIRSGALRYDEDLAAVLALEVRDELMVANPGWLDG